MKVFSFCRLCCLFVRTGAAGGGEGDTVSFSGRPQLRGRLPCRQRSSRARIPFAVARYLHRLVRVRR